MVFGWLGFKQVQWQVMKVVFCSFFKLSFIYVIVQKFSVFEKKEIFVRMTFFRGFFLVSSFFFLLRLLGIVYIILKFNIINSKYLLSYIFVEGRKVRGGLVVWFWFGVWYEVWAGLQLFKDLIGVGGFIFEDLFIWLGKVLVFRRGFQFFFTGISLVWIFQIFFCYLLIFLQ